MIFKKETEKQHFLLCGIKEIYKYKIISVSIPSVSWFNNTCQKLCEVTALLGPSEVDGLVLGVDSGLLSPITANISTTGKCFPQASLPLGLLQSGKPIFQSTSNYQQ